LAGGDASEDELEVLLTEDAVATAAAAAAI
jgi:hypothetical protein